MRKTVLAIVLLLAAALHFSFQPTSKTGFDVGDKVPEIKLPGTDGRFIALSSLKGKLVLIDFWAAWCVPCRNENPNLVLAYNKFKQVKFKNGEGFEIYSISLDNQKEAWLKAIEKDNLYWKSHVSELMYWNDKTTKLFGINIIPYNLLIDGDGVILARNLIGTDSTSGSSKLEIELTKHKK